MKKNDGKRNDGKWFEEMIAKSALEYERKGILTIRKVDPPTRIVRFGGKMLAVPTESPFLDFVGTWTERGGKGIFLEAKTTSEDRLPIDSKDSGVKRTQITSMKHWNMNGAAVGVLWAMDKDHIVFLNLPQIKAAVAAGRRSLKFGEGLPVLDLNKWVSVDFIHALRATYPEYQ